MRTFASVLAVGALLIGAPVPMCTAADPPHPLMQWVKVHPLPGAARPSPRLGYETAYGYDPVSRLLIRYGGHNQGGGGEQNAEVWTYDLDTDAWAFKEPNDAPPGVCCDQQNVFDDAAGKYVRFPSFSGNHGWQSFREIRLKDSAVWVYDLPTNTWRNMRPCPAPRLCALRGAAYDPQHQVTVIHGGETAGHGTLVYDLYANTVYEMKPRGPAPENSLSQPGFTYDAVNRVFVLFGSQFASDDRTWLYDLRKNAWRVLPVAEHPPGEKTSPVLAADTRSGIVLASVQTASESRTLETWALDVAKVAWTRLRLDPQPGDSGNRNRAILYLPDRNLFVLENRTKGEEGKTPAEQQLWTFRYAEALPPPPQVRLSVVTEKSAARLSWEATPGGPAAAWDVYRGQGARPWEADLQRIGKADGGSFKDEGLKAGEVYFYQVRREGADGKTFAASFLARTQPPVVMGLVVSAVDPRRAELAWEKLATEDVAGYHVERAEVGVYSSDQVRRIRVRYKPAADPPVGAIKAIGAFRRLTAAPLADPRYVDDTVDFAAGQKDLPPPLTESRPLHPDEFVAAGKPYRYATYAYRIVAVNRLGVESGPSPLAFSWPAAVQNVFAKEEGAEGTRLKWQANSEKGAKVYLVYRHEGPYDKEPIVRLTSDPIAATTMLDENAGKTTRRYEVVAVDALGQEGEPSQPVWSRREWARFYTPYTGEWHQ
ncbi:MAG: kelch repeat-containing protein, partial [Planctomycetota bacterium]|nr:kelch repeat-containing protein [Planctomycetota bacterium]